jgi:signal transduction histidine kinase/ligand-binding sensor domain-containing protein
MRRQSLLSWAFCRPLWLLAIALWLCLMAAVSAGDRPWTLPRFQHTAWSAKDGAPVAISTLAQTPDGILWVGGGAGLYTFDGRQFGQFTGVAGKSLMTSQVLSLCPARDGSLWIGYEGSGISHLISGALINYDANAGYVSTNTNKIVETADGTIWAASTKGLMHFSRGKWVATGVASGLKEGGVGSILMTRDGTLWTTQNGRILGLKEGSAKFFDAGVTLESKKVLDIAAAPDGLMVSYVNGPIVRYHRRGDTLSEADGAALPLFGSALFDRRGSLWITGGGSGVTHFADPQSWYSNPHALLDKTAELYRKVDGLTGDYVWPVLEDAEGDIWVGTADGLDRFRAADFALVNTPSGAHDFALAPAAQGKVWSGTSTNPVMLLDDNAVEWTSVPPFTLALYRDANDQTVWAAGRQGIWQLRPEGGVFVTPLPNDVEHRLPFALARDHQSVLWVTMTSPQGKALTLYSYADGKWTVHPDQTKVTALATSRAGELRVGHEDNRIDVISEGKTRSFTVANGVAIGKAHAFADGHEKGVLWVGGSAGLGYLREGRFHKVTLDDSTELNDITAVLFAQDGSLWVHALKGVIRISAGDVGTAEAHPDTPISYRLFDAADGVVGVAGQAIPLPSGIIGTDGRLWFSTSSGVLWVDPSRLIPRGASPPIKIGPVVVDGTTISMSNGARLPSLSHDIHLTFNAQTLSRPESVAYRIRLEPLDDSWLEVGARNEITYATLGPGRYTFRVQSHRRGESWQEPGASLAFTVTAAFYQTYWFYALCALLLVLAALSAHMLNIRRMAKQSQVRFNERTWERERIARELHDTMLQDMQALAMHLRQFESNECNETAVQTGLASANELAANALHAARNSVKHLRDQEPRCADLIASLEDTANHLKRHYPVAIHLSVSGKVKKLQSAACEEVLAIAREAILNALKHANPTFVDVQVHFSRRHLELVVKDDGIGIQPELASQRQAEGHWGLKGMNERAATLGGALKIRPGDPHGTEVLLRVPSGFVSAEA